MSAGAASMAGRLSRPMGSANLRHRIVGVTPYFPVSSREAECLHYVQEHVILRYVAIDDDAHLFTDQCAGLFLTDRYCGLDCIYTEALIRLIKTI